MASVTRNVKATFLTVLDYGDPTSNPIYKLKMTIFDIKKKTKNFSWEAFLKVAKILAGIDSLLLHLQICISILMSFTHCICKENLAV